VLEGVSAPRPAGADESTVKNTATQGLAVPELAEIEVNGMTREAFLARATLAAGAAYGLGAVAAFVQDAFAQQVTKLEAPGDLDILNFTLTLQLIEQSLYNQAQGGRAGGLFDQLARDEADHVGELRRLIRKLRGRPIAPPTVDFGGRGSSLQTPHVIEDTVVFTINTILPNLESKELLNRLAALVQVDARHAALIALPRGGKPAPKAFEDTLTIPQARERLSPYVPEFGAS